MHSNDAVGRPPPFNPGHSTGRHHQQLPVQPQTSSKYTNHLSAVAPPLPQRRCSSLPRRIHRPSSDAPPLLFDAPPPDYEETMNTANMHRVGGGRTTIGFESFSSVPHHQQRSRAALPMSPSAVDDHFTQRPPPPPSRERVTRAAPTSGPCRESAPELSAGYRPPRTPRVSTQSGFSSPTSPISPLSDRGLPGGCNTPGSYRSPGGYSTPGSYNAPGGYSTADSYSTTGDGSLSVRRGSLPSRSHGRQRTSSTGSHIYSGSNNVNISSRSTAESVSLRMPVERLDDSVSLVSTIDLRTGQSPASVSLSRSGSLLMIIDTHAMIVSLLDTTGRERCTFRVVGVRGGCFVTDDKLALVTHRGLRLCSTDGTVIEEVSLGPVVSVKLYGHELVVVRPRGLTFFSSTSCKQHDVLDKVRSHSGLFRRSRSFVELVDVAVTSRQLLVVVDGGHGVLYVIDRQGKVHTKIRPSRLPCGPLLRPVSVCTDRHDNIVLSDSGNRRVLLFLSTGVYQSTLLSLPVVPAHSSTTRLNVDTSVTIRGLTISTDGRLVVILAGDHCSELRSYVF